MYLLNIMFLELSIIHLSKDIIDDFFAVVLEYESRRTEFGDGLGLIAPVVIKALLMMIETELLNIKGTTHITNDV